jgi:hypothetical protein
MSDIAATAWWTSGLFLVWRQGRVTALAAGVATGMAILTRPNLVPLAIIPGAVFLIGLRSREERALAVQRLLLFAVPSVGACVLVAYLNTYWYGSPTASGYGRLAGELFKWEYYWPNLRNFTTWILRSQGPLSLLSVVGLFALVHTTRTRRERTILIGCLAFVVAVYACYAFYLPLEDWWSLRLLFPAFPIFFILLAAGGLAIADRLPHGWRGVGVAVLVAAVTLHLRTFGNSNGVFHPEDELRFAVAGRYINDHMSPRAVFFSMLHSGSVRYYSGRLTVRYDWLQHDDFETMVTHLRRRGYIPFLLIDDAEEAEFRDRFAGVPSAKPRARQVRFARVSLYSL